MFLIFEEKFQKIELLSITNKYSEIHTFCKKDFHEI